MTSIKPRSSSFSRNLLVGPTCQTPGLKPGPNGLLFISSGIPDLDRILGGGFCLGSLIMVMEDPEAPHHLLLLRNFMAQGLVHGQPLFFASPSKDPRAFLGTLPRPISSNDDKPREPGFEQEKGLRIAWQYQKYFGEDQKNSENRDTKHEYCNDFDLRKPLERHILSQKLVDCVSTNDSSIGNLRESCSMFLARHPRVDGGDSSTARMAIQSFCAPQSEYFKKCLLAWLRIGPHVQRYKLEITGRKLTPSESVGRFSTGDIYVQVVGRFLCGILWIRTADPPSGKKSCCCCLLLLLKEWDVLSFIKSLKDMIRSSNTVAMITFPHSLLSASFSKRCQHLADTLLSVKAIPDEDKELEKLLTGYHEMVGLLHVQKVARINTQVPLILEASTFSIKLHKRRSLALECLNQAPIDGSSGSSYGTSSSCYGSSKHGTLDF